MDTDSWRCAFLSLYLLHVPEVATRQEKANHKAWNRHHLTVMERLLPAFQNPEGRAESHCPHHEVTSGTAEHHTTDLQITHRTEATIS